MSEGEKVVSLIIVSIVTIIAIVAMSSSWYYSTVNRQFIEAGYEQRTLPGEEGVHWVKMKPQAEIEGHDVGN